MNISAQAKVLMRQTIGSPGQHKEEGAEFLPLLRWVSAAVKAGPSQRPDPRLVSGEERLDAGNR